ncbi:hypothetical protein [Sphingobacterium anhuiense]|uniref:Uncharacterized protein n=1 Tax=Sphingobacterium anhuiense TaxID=493780 RepID=A0ABW5YYK2_9SPHI
MKDKISFDFERFKNESMQGFYEHKSLTPNDGTLAQLITHSLKSIFDMLHTKSRGGL